MSKVQAIAAYLGAATGLLSACASLADRCATFVARELAAQSRAAALSPTAVTPPVSRVARFLEAQKLDFAPKEPSRVLVVPMTAPAVHVAVLAQALDRAETAHVPAPAAAGLPGATATWAGPKRVRSAAVAGYVRRGHVGLRTKIGTKLAAGPYPQAKSAHKARRSGFALAAGLQPAKAVIGPRRMRVVFAETPGHIMSEKFSGRRS